MKALSLFSGIGLHDLGLERAGWEIAGQVEIDPWCRAVLAKHWPATPKWEDVRDVTASALGFAPDLVTGGFPCTNTSTAGRGVGLLRGEHSSLWLEMLRIIRDCRPAWVLAENVPGLRTRGIDSVLSGLEEAGYAACPLVVGAWAVGAPHRRDRVWIVGRRVADVSRDGQLGKSETKWPDRKRAWAGGDERMADSDSSGLAVDGGEPGNAREERAAPLGGGWPGVAHPEDGRRPPEGERRDESPHSWAGRPGEGWPAGRGEPQYPWEPPRILEPRLGRDVTRRAARLDRFARRNRLRALGNANPWQVPYLIGRWMLEGGV